MRLLNVSENYEAEDLPGLIDFLPDKIPPYAILSHRWNSSPSEEISFADLVQRTETSTELLRLKQEYQKFRLSCAQARQHGLDYLWVDTCCIDKSSSAELSEAINSMYTWYSRAQVCFVYLNDVSSVVDLEGDNSEFMRTEWATRGWTLQELLAPSRVIFYSCDWHEIGTKESLGSILSTMTGIEEQYLISQQEGLLWSASVAKRMSWVARRKTSRPEDIAYCMMGLFQVNMPMLYGEGENAFVRLQEEIMKRSDDHSLFAWTEQGQGESTGHGLLAKHPRCFEHSGGIIPYASHETRAPFSLTNRGLCIDLRLYEIETNSTYIAALDCPVPPDYRDQKFLAIFLKKVPFSHDQYARVNIDKLSQTTQSRGRLQTIYVRQTDFAPTFEGIFPMQTLQLRRLLPQNIGYRVAQTKVRKGTAFAVLPRPTPGTEKDTKDWLPRGCLIACRIATQGTASAHFGIRITFDDNEDIIVLLGMAGFQVGFSVIQSTSMYITAEDWRKLFEADFTPLPPGSHVETEQHRVSVSAEPLVDRSTKYYMIDIEIGLLAGPSNFTKSDITPTEQQARNHNTRKWIKAMKQPFTSLRTG